MYVCMHVCTYIHTCTYSLLVKLCHNQNNHSHHGRKMDGGQQLIAYAISCIHRKGCFIKYTLASNKMKHFSYKSGHAM